MRRKLETLLAASRPVNINASGSRRQKYGPYENHRQRKPRRHKARDNMLRSIAYETSVKLLRTQTTAISLTYLSTHMATKCHI